MFKMGCISSKTYEPTDKEIIENYLDKLQQKYDENETLYEYTCRMMQGLYFGDRNIGIEDEIIINNLWKIIKNNKSLGDHSIKYFRTDFNKLAKEAEDNMIRVLNENPQLKKWFIEYEPPHHMFNSHPNMIKLTNLVNSDGHSGASFALCCRSVKRKLKSV